MKTNRVLIFDFDGTICDSQYELINILNELAPFYRYQKVSQSEVPQLRHMTTSELMSYLEIAKWKIPFIVYSARRAMSRRMHLLKPFEAIVSTFEKIRETGAKIIVLSTNSTANIQAFMNAHTIACDEIIGNVSLFGKYQALKRLKQRLPNTTYFYIGDEIRDLVASKRAQVPSVAVSWGYNSALKLAEYQPQHMIQAPEELIRLL